VVSGSEVVAVVRVGCGGHRLTGRWEGVEIANRFLGHLETRRFSPATVRAYAFDLLCWARFLDERSVPVGEVTAMDVFDWIDWQSTRERPAGKVVSITAARPAAAASVNRRVAAVRAFYEFLVMTGTLAHNPVPSARRSSGLRARPRGVLGHVGSKRPRGQGRLVRQPRRLPESLDADDVSVFLADLCTHRDRAIVLAMLLGGLRAGEVRGLLLADVDVGMRRVRVVGKGGRERLVPIDRAFFAELTAYLRTERPPGCATPECFVVLRGPTTGRALTESGLRSVFRTHRARTGAIRVRPHRLRHTYGTELAAAGIDLLVLRDLMGHASPETTAGYVHLAPEIVAAEWARAKGMT
jgi:integrase/recombinase XerC